jgi:hypothetical protein
MDVIGPNLGGMGQLDKGEATVKGDFLLAFNKLFPVKSTSPEGKFCGWHKDFIDGATQL